MNEEFDDILESGDESAIESALEEMGVEDALLGDGETQEPEAEKSNEPEQSQDEGTQEAEQANTETDVKETTESSTEGEVSEADYIEKDGKHYVLADGVASKNGEHRLPYEVLERTRQEKQQLAQEREQLAQEKAELEARASEYERTSNLYKQQLEEANLDPKLLPEQMLQDPELLERIKTDYPELGDAFGAMVNQFNQLKQSQTQAQPSQTQDNQPDAAFQQAFDSSDHLKTWMTSDAEKWSKAQQIDEQLADDPAFANKPVSERLAEVERRTMLAFENKQTQQPKASDKLSGTPLPNSPTDIANAGSSTGSNTHILEHDAETLTAEMSSMSTDAIESLLEDVSDFI